MERAGVSVAARTAAEDEEDDHLETFDLEEEDGGPMVACELEAAKALAGLAGFSALHGGAVTSGELERRLVTEAAGTSTSHSQDQDQIIAGRQFWHYASPRITSPEKTDKIVENIPCQLRRTNCQSNSASKSRPKLTQAEKEARKIRRVLANRESARQTIRRRQAMYVDLTRKAADVLEENENLKKLAKIKEAEERDAQEEPNTSQAEKSTSTPIYPPSIFPCFWPSILPSSDVFKFQCASHSNNNISSSQGTPLFLYPVPWLFPFFGHSNTLHSYYGTKEGENAHQCNTCSCSETPVHEDNSQLSTNRNMGAEASNSKKSMDVGGVRGPGLTFPSDSGDENTARHPNGTIFVPGLFSRVRESPGPSRNCDVDDTCDVNVVSPHERMRHGLSQKNQEAIVSRHYKNRRIFSLQ
ncbi:hypothetical protein DH2020_018091 [Rehmannia glutinosa]|uniref:BZIP domain-containing protein n=1 Tax=Rehmannia glutinosa TaxID=99300 RepID=A0ABR0WLE0_REHGL